MTGAVPQWFRKATEARPEESVTVVDGADIAYRAWGESGREGIVLVHGGAAHGGWWDHIAPFLAEDGKRVVALDLSGHGDSAHRTSYNLAGWAAEVLGVGDAAGVAGRPLVIGHSMGGFIGLWTAMAYRARVAGTIVVDSPLRELSLEEELLLADVPVQPHRVHRDRDDVTRRFRPIPEQPALDYVAAHIAARSVGRVHAGWSWKFDPRIIMRGHLAPSQLRDPGTPVALIRGERGLLTRDMAEETSRRFDSRTPVVEIPDAGHHIMLDQPLALVSALRALVAVWPPHALSPSAGGLLHRTKS